jgi:hypothetical protein
MTYLRFVPPVAFVFAIGAAFLSARSFAVDGPGAQAPAANAEPAEFDNSTGRYTFAAAAFMERIERQSAALPRSSGYLGMRRSFAVDGPEIMATIAFRDGASMRAWYRHSFGKALGQVAQGASLPRLAATSPSKATCRLLIALTPARCGVVSRDYGWVEGMSCHVLQTEPNQ